jgi:hypothetical protein
MNSPGRTRVEGIFRDLGDPEAERRLKAVYSSIAGSPER